jgi:hypothetical protein
MATIGNIKIPKNWENLNTLVFNQTGKSFNDQDIYHFQNNSNGYIIFQETDILPENDNFDGIRLYPMQDNVWKKGDNYIFVKMSSISEFSGILAIEDSN